MDGDITVSSVCGEGSVFTARLPQTVKDGVPIGNISDYADLRDESRDGNVRFTAPAARLLIVDDNAANLKVAEGLLAPYRSRIDICMSGAEAIRLARENRYDVIFMDHMMPEMDGMEAAAAIRALEGEYFKTLPIVALTANAVVGMRETFLQNGFSDYLPKPIEIAKLNEIMEKWIPREKREKAAPEQEVAGAPFHLEIEGLNTARGMVMTGGSASNYMDVLALFCKDAAGRLEILSETLDEAKLPLFVSQFHALKSALASIGAADLAKESALLEEAGRRGDMILVWNKLTAFRENLFRAAANIRTALDDAQERRKTERRKKTERRTASERRSGIERRNIAASPDTDKLLRLKQALEAEDMVTVDGVLAEISNAALDADTKTVLASVAEQVLLFELEEAARIVGGLLEEYRR
jgi:CheY-like chemotaxis protein